MTRCKKDTEQIFTGLGHGLEDRDQIPFFLLKTPPKHERSRKTQPAALRGVRSPVDAGGRELRPRGSLRPQSAARAARPPWRCRRAWRNRRPRARRRRAPAGRWRWRPHGAAHEHARTTGAGVSASLPPCSKAPCRGICLHGQGVPVTRRAPSSLQECAEAAAGRWCAGCSDSHCV